MVAITLEFTTLDAQEKILSIIEDPQKKAGLLKFLGENGLKVSDIFQKKDCGNDSDREQS